MTKALKAEVSNLEETQNLDERGKTENQFFGFWREKGGTNPTISFGLMAGW